MSPVPEEVATGLWHWQAPHPEWDDSVWPQAVSSYAIDDGERLLLFDPIATPDEIVRRGDGRELVVVMTTDPGEGSPDVEWLVSGEAGEPHLYSAGGSLPDGIEAAFPGREPNDVVLEPSSRRCRRHARRLRRRAEDSRAVALDATRAGRRPATPPLGSTGRARSGHPRWPA